jgi:hypothetical protein
MWFSLIRREYVRAWGNNTTACASTSVPHVLYSVAYIPDARQRPPNKQRDNSLCQAEASVPMNYLERGVFCGVCADGCANSNGYNNGNYVFCAVRAEVIQVGLWDLKPKMTVRARTSRTDPQGRSLWLARQDRSSWSQRHQREFP